jgi:hypothetical protein
MQLRARLHCSTPSHPSLPVLAAGPLLQPKGQTSVFYKVPPPLTQQPPSPAASSPEGTPAAGTTPADRTPDERAGDSPSGGLPLAEDESRPPSRT